MTTKDEDSSVRIKRLSEVKQEYDELKRQIQKAPLTVVIFIDIVNSTEILQQKYQNSPHEWIYAFGYFYNYISEEVNKCRGKIVKFIGDCTLIKFDVKKYDVNGEDYIDNKPVIEGLFEFIETFNNHIQIIFFDNPPIEIQLKTAIDYGSAWKYQKDILGLCISRCTRILEYVPPGKVLASEDFKRFTEDQEGNFNWTCVSQNIPLKGVGSTSIYLLGQELIKIDRNIRVKQKDYENLRDFYDKYNEEMANKGRIIADQKQSLSLLEDKYNKLRQMTIWQTVVDHLFSK